MLQYVKQLEDVTMKDPLFTTYRFSLLMQALNLLAKQRLDEANGIYEVVETTTLRYQKVNTVPLGANAQAQYSEAVFQRSLSLESVMDRTKRPRSC